MANNYTNSFLPGYLNTIRKVSISRGNGGDILAQARSINFFFAYRNILIKVSSIFAFSFLLQNLCSSYTFL